MDSGNFRANQEIANMTLSDCEEPSLDSDSQLLSPDNLSFVDQNIKSPTDNEPPSKLKHHFKNIPFTTTTELNDSLVSKMSNLNLAIVKERPNSLVIDKTEDVNIKTLKGLDYGKDSKPNSVLQTTTDHPLKMLSPDIDYPDVVPKVVSSESNLNAGLINGFTPQRNNSKSNLYVENFITPEFQPFMDIENKDIQISPPDFAKLNAENLLNNENVKKKVFNASILSKNSSTPISNVIKQDLNVSAIGDIVQSSNKSECDRNISNAIIQAEKEETFYDMPAWGEDSSNFKSFSNYELPLEMTNPPAPNVKRCPQSPDILSSPSEDRSKYQAIIDPYSCNVILKHTPAADSAVRQTMRRRIVIPDDISMDSGSVCSLELEEDSPDLQETNPHIPELHALERDSVCEGGECSGVREMTVRGDGSTSNVAEKSTSTSSCEPIPEYSLEEEQYETRSFMEVAISNGVRVECDMRVVEPYKRVVSHGGYTDGRGAIIVVCACRLPHTARPDYHYVMTNLFLYVMYTIEKLVTDSYVLVYVHGAASKGRIPSWHWLKESYKLIDRRLRKSMKRLYLVHPTFWLKSLLLLSKPFVSHKFYNKVTYVKNLRELMQRIPVEPNAIPDIVKDYDATLK